MKKVLAVLLALSVSASAAVLLASCGKESDADTTVADTTEADTTVADTTEALTVAQTSAPDTTVADTTETVSDTTAVSETETATEAPKAPSTAVEVVEYYNKAMNAAKKDSKSVTYNYMKHAPAGSVSGLPKMFGSLADSVIESNTGADKTKTNLQLNTTALKNANMPVENESWASKLTADDVKSATCTEKDGTYTIKIVTKADDFLANVKHGSNHNPKAFNVVLPSTVSDNIPSAVSKVFSIGTVAIAFPSSTITVKVDAATGNVKSANYLMYWTMKIPLGDKDVIIPFSTESDYTVNW